MHETADLVLVNGKITTLDRAMRTRNHGRPIFRRGREDVLGCARLFLLGPLL
jgi:hypothetical protein